MHAASHCGRFSWESARTRCAGSVSPAASHVSQKRDAAPTGGECVGLDRGSGGHAVLCPDNVALRTEARDRCARVLLVVGVANERLRSTREGEQRKKAAAHGAESANSAFSQVDGTLFAESSRGTRELGKYPRGTRGNHQQKHWHEGARCKTATVRHSGWA